MRNYFNQGNIALLDERPTQEVGFDVGWQQLQRVCASQLEGPALVDTLHESVIQEEMGWQPVLLSGGKGRPNPSLDSQTRQGLAGLENCLQSLLMGKLVSSAGPEYRLDSFSEIVIPQFNARKGAWQLSA